MLEFAAKPNAQQPQPQQPPERLKFDEVAAINPHIVNEFLTDIVFLRGKQRFFGAYRNYDFANYCGYDFISYVLEPLLFPHCHGAPRWEARWEEILHWSSG